MKTKKVKRNIFKGEVKDAFGNIIEIGMPVIVALNDSLLTPFLTKGTISHIRNEYWIEVTVEEVVREVRRSAVFIQK